MTVCIVHYNTPELTAAAIRSLWKHTPTAKVIVFDNSDQRPFSRMDNGQWTIIKVLDNTHGQLIDFDAYLSRFPDRETGSVNKSSFGSAKHALSVQWLIDHADDGFLLMDSDVLIRRDITPFFYFRYAFVAHIGCNTRRRFGLEIFRAEPLLCYINVPMLREHGVRYFNPDYMWALSDVSPNNRYDTGAWFLKDVIDHDLPYLHVDVIADYALHFGHGSWRTKDPTAWLEANRNLWE